ncbi:uncharacterized protein BX664DRAFT_329365 [Halteromyces radiatus]|uniref:uncharacterized protein n=1 Tax=Halteromyces radiatus TaxID=101107 RepID=UPI00221FDE47|nr:uncharacterized protein BX664DRAFT_329365 [Halteromyces radiatus]KAI8093279.1 hypothetical protein BX664DRAFT_329365 [Halteromyces radiatus]
MYQTDPHPDPYANQYPPPPPLTSEHHTGYGSPPPVPQTTNNTYIPPPQHTYTPPLQQHGYPIDGQHHTSTSIPLVDRQSIAGVGHQPSYDNYHSVPMTNDPHVVNMGEYQTAAQGEHMYNNQHTMARQEDYYADYRDEPDSHTPMVQPSEQKQYSIQPEDQEGYKRPIQSNNNKNKKYMTPGPMMAPEDEAESYRPKQYRHDDDRRGGCNCCCYNPAMTCCSCFCFLISLAFLAAGIALMIAAKVIGDKCNTQCGDAVDTAKSYGVNAQPCDAICGKVVHDGMFYGGIAVAVLAGIAAIWKIFMWMCAAGSRR